jgi:hypothetical protein
LKTRTAILVVALLASFVLFSIFPLGSWAAGANPDDDKSSTMVMMERAEGIVYGEPNRGGLIERLNSIETELFGRGLPGSISERQSAVLNFLEIGTPEQPSMLFKLGVAEWLVGQTSQVRRGALPRVERLETDLDGSMQYGRPLAMRVERLLASLVTDPVTFEDVVLPNSTVMKLQFLEELGPATAKKGDVVALALTNDLMVGNVLVAPKGSLIDTVVREVKQPRRGGIPSEISFDFRTLIPLGPQRPKVFAGEASKKATTEAQKSLDKGVGGMAGAVGVGVGGVLLLGPAGLLPVLLVRGNAIKIPEGTIMFLETSGDIRISGYPVPASLNVDPNATIRESVGSGIENMQVIELPAEQKIN